MKWIVGKDSETYSGARAHRDILKESNAQKQKAVMAKPRKAQDVRQ